MLRRWIKETFGLSYLDELRLYIALGVVRDKMIPAIKAFFMDPTAASRYIRSAIWALYAAYTTGMLPAALLQTKTGWYIAQFLPALAFMIGAGEKNQSAGVLKAIANDPMVSVTAANVETADAARLKGETTPPGM